ncbi:IS110 family RNA-guided transposase [Rhodococcus rhodochrous]|uniref:IS110 family transposase n=1 Tax=Rhodococcus rhodochrous TaxID=1829 RepID=UPI00178563A8|nr:IS110 family transposase [Rhodococcus rhodochrous]QOH58089.1 IS110 family transposase [Rhodococcus rhodochrous]QOH59425.1 IS110 family transposase [Rhodococcus rhodochrous]
MLFIGDDWAEGHHDIEVEDDTGRRLARMRLPEGVEGLARLHEVIAEHLDTDPDGIGTDVPTDGAVVVGIETDRGVWVSALLACGYQVYVINPMSAARYRERHGTSGAKSDAGDAHVLAEIIRVDRDHHRQIAGDSTQVEALKLLTRAHQGLIWDRTRHLQRMRSALREYFPAALTAFDNLAAPDTLALLQKAPDPDRAARLTTGQITAELARAHRRGDRTAKATRIRDALRAPALRQPAEIENAYAIVVVGQARMLEHLNVQIDELEQEVKHSFRRHPAADIVRSCPGLGDVLGARVLAEFGDDPHRYRNAKARKNYAGTSPITRASGKRKTVSARYARNKHLADACHQWAFCSMNTSPGARAYYDALRAREVGHHAALRQLGNRLVGILHGCVKTGTVYDENTAWPQVTTQTAA